MTEKISNEEIFVLEASKSAVIDTVWTKTIAGKQWFVNYKSNLTESAIKSIKFFPSDTKFKLVDGKQVLLLLSKMITLQHLNKVDLCFSSSGQLLCKYNLRWNKYKQVKKIQTQFGHVWKDNISKILPSANLINSHIELIVKKVVNSCKASIQFRKPSPIPSQYCCIFESWRF